MKTLLMLLVAVVAWWLWRGLFRDRFSSDETRREAVRASTDDTFTQETVVACAYCQLHLPHSEAVWSGDKAFCGQAHLQAYQVENAGQ
jgi:ABC-type nickel/cobalt efflux system permease component RcnA